jgi:malate dehydrogenase (oxaloacetate-decarboxylating)(NADP+)
MYIILTKNDVLFFADCTTHIDPSTEQLAQTALLATKAARYFNVTPKVAMLSFSNFGSARHSESHKVRKAVELVRAKEPGLCVDGELQVDVALSKDLQDDVFPFCELKGAANVLVFPNLSAGLIASKLVTRLGQAESIGPLVLGLSKPVAALTHWCDVEEVVNTTTIMAIECLDGTL